MEELNLILPVIVYALLIILLIVGIILGIKLIMVTDKVDKVIQNVDKKVKAFDGLFSIVDLFSDKVGALTSNIVEWVVGLFDKIKSLKNRKDEEEDYE